MNAFFKSVNLLEDIYFQEAYAALYAGQDAELFRFDFQEDGERLINLSLKRPILAIGNEACHEGFFDLETPYGYGGFYTDSCNPDFLKRAMTAYREYCVHERIIAEFVRFHPANVSHELMPDQFVLLAHDRNVVMVDLKADREERWAGYHAKTRNLLRKCARSLTVAESDDLPQFEQLYSETMKKNAATDFYYFNRSYYDALLALDGVKLYKVDHDDQTIAMAFIMRGKEMAHYHLSANSPESLRLNANYFLLDHIFDEMRVAGSELFLLGGGRTPEPEDTLFRFKQKFSRVGVPFYIGGLIHDREKYLEYVERWESLYPECSLRYFLKYRLTGD